MIYLLSLEELEQILQNRKLSNGGEIFLFAFDMKQPRLSVHLHLNTVYHVPWPWRQIWKYFESRIYSQISNRAISIHLRLKDIKESKNTHRCYSDYDLAFVYKAQNRYIFLNKKIKSWTTDKWLCKTYVGNIGFI